MSILASLAKAYERLPDAPPYGYSSEKIGVVVSLNDDGSVANVTDWRDGEGKKRKPRMMMVPQAVKRTVGIAPCFLWDKTSYVLGVTGGEGKRTAEEHQAFVDRHLEAIGDNDDAGLRALVRFLEAWTPEQFTEPLWLEEMKDQNVVFVLESDRHSNKFLHDRPAARALWGRVSASSDANNQICLVTGEEGPVERLHPSIKGVWGAQSSGASIVSFNQDAFTSYDHAQGDNAPVSAAAVFAYTTTLNRFLERDSGHRIQVGDASTPFWAEAADVAVAQEAEELFELFFDAADAAVESRKVAAETEETARRVIEVQLERIRQGQNLAEVEPKLAENVRFNVLGLAPNAARLSIRFFYSDDFGALTRNYQRFVADTRINPPPREGYPPLWRYLQQTAVLGKRENVPPNLAGEWMRAILSGGRYPMTLMSSVITRIRADGEINALRVGILKAVLVRNFWSSVAEGRDESQKEEALVALEPENPDPAYVLGRLFAVLERMQTLALGRINATIRDRYYGAASATPATVFPLLLRLNQHHKSKAEKDDKTRGLAIFMSRQIGEIMSLLPASFPHSLNLQSQGKFAIGYYHQAYRPKDEKPEENEPLKEAAE